MAAKSPSDSNLEALAGFFERYMADPATEIPEATNVLRDRLDEHFGVDSSELQTSATTYGRHMEVAYQRAINELIDSAIEHEVIGIRCPSIPEQQMGEMALAWMLCRPTFAFVPPVFCPPDYAMTPSGVHETEACIHTGLVLFRDSEGPGLLWIRFREFPPLFTLEVMTASEERTERILDQLYKAALRLSPYRGQLIGIESGPKITFLERPADTSRDEVILPAGLLDQIERHSLNAVKAHAALVKSGRHSKRGLLLHGRPGTGKTHTIKYLISKMPEATVAVMSASRLHHLGVLTEVMDMIVPGVIILDDVDLIAEDREMSGSRASLFQLLDVLDGIADDEDLLFLLTTNRPNEIEPAIAARPGRVDQAIEVPLPDAECRRRLFELYADGLDVEIDEAQLASFLDRTEGVTASFIREVLRRATVAVLRDGETTEPIPVSGARIHAALDELLSAENPLTPLLLGAVPKHALPTVTVASLPSPAQGAS